MAGFLTSLKERLRGGGHKASSSEAQLSAQSSQPSPVSGSPGGMFGAHRPDFGSEDDRCAAGTRKSGVPASRHKPMLGCHPTHELPLG